MPFVYILWCADGSLYTGAARDLAERLRQHEAGRASRYTRARLPVRLAWSRRARTWSVALAQEYALKQLSRAEKDALVAGGAVRIARPSGGTKGARVAKVRPAPARKRPAVGRGQRGRRG